MRLGPLRQTPTAHRNALTNQATEWSAVGLITVASAALGIANGGYSQEAVAIATVIVWAAIAVGLVVGLWSGTEIPRAALLSGACLLGLLVLTTASMAWADDPERSFVAAIRVGGYLGLFALVVVAAPRTGKRAWILGLAAGMTIVCMTALGSRFAPSLFGDVDRELAAALPNAAARLSYPIGYWNGLAAFLAIDAVLLVWLGAYGRGRAGRAVAVGLLPLPILGIYLASSRGGLAAAVIGGAVLVIFARSRAAVVAGAVLGGAGGAVLVLVARTQDQFLAGVSGASASHQGNVMLLVTLVCVGLVVAARYLLDRWLGGLRLSPRAFWPWAVGLIVVIGVVIGLASRESADVGASGGHQGGVPAGHLTSAGASGRGQFWQAALDAFTSHPVAGVGAGNFELYWNAHPQLPLPLVNAHSLYLEALAELGVGGLALILGFLAIPVVGAARRSSFGGSAVGVDAALAVLAAGAFSAAIEWTWQIPAAFAPVILAAGLLAGGRAPEVRGHPRTQEGQFRFGLGIATLVVAWGVVWAAAVSFIGSRELAASRSAAARGDLTAAANDARVAGHVQPWSPEPPLQLALVEELGGDLEAARMAALDAIHHAPGDWRPWAVAGRIAAKAGDPRAAAYLLARAEALSPVMLPRQFSRHLDRRA